MIELGNKNISKAIMSVCLPYVQEARGKSEHIK